MSGLVRAGQRGQLALTVLAALWAVMRSGLGVYPGAQITLETASTWPFPSDPRPSEQFYVESPLGMLLARALGITSLPAYLWLHIALLLAGLTLISVLLLRTADGTLQWRSVRLFWLAPVVAVCWMWVGSYDAMTVVLWGGALLAYRLGSRPLMLVAGLALGFHATLQALLGIAVWWLVASSLSNDRPARSTNPLWAVPGIAVGGIGLAWALAAGEHQGRLSVLGLEPLPLLRDGAQSFPLLLWSLFGGLWLVLIIIWQYAHRRQRALLCLAFLIALGSLVIAQDRTRVFTLITLPALVLLIEWFGRHEHVWLTARGRVAVESLAWVAVPIVVWGTTVANSENLSRMDWLRFTLLQ